MFFVGRKQFLECTNCTGNKLVLWNRKRQNFLRVKTTLPILLGWTKEITPDHAFMLIVSIIMLDRKLFPIYVLRW